MKRWIEESGKAAADCLMLLSEVGAARVDEEKPSTICLRLFACKTCGKKFQTFQALGGHRAGHKRARAAGELSLYTEIISPPKPKKTHECSICGVEFPIGQALGGHMRRHRSASSCTTPQNYEKKLKLSHEHDDGEVVSEEEETPAAVAPVMKRSGSFSKRVVCLDLNLTPLENDLVKLKMGKPATIMTPIFKRFLQI